jgi:hypothetical protein
VGKSVLDEIYVALRNLLTSRIVSPETKTIATQVVNEINREAAKESILYSEDDGSGSNAAD